MFLKELEGILQPWLCPAKSQLLPTAPLGSEVGRLAEIAVKEEALLFEFL